MEQRRRAFLKAVGACSVVTLAGCTSGGNDDGKNFTGPPAQQVSKLAACDGTNGDQFGVSVAVSDDGSTAIIGASRNEDPNGGLGGSAYVFTGDGSSWTQQAKLAPDDGNKVDFFGDAVAVSGDGTTAVLSSPLDDDDTGSAYVFIRDGGSWTQQAKLTADGGGPNDQFGKSVAISRDGATAIMGAPVDNEMIGPVEDRRLRDDNPGAAYVFTGNSGSWTQQAKLTATDGGLGDRFGESVAVSRDGETVVVGADSNAYPNITRTDSTYVFTRDGDSWTQQTKLTPEQGDEETSFGQSVAVSGDGSTVVVGDTNGRTGVAYLFTRGNSTWTQQTKLTAEDAAYEYFGYAVGISGGGETITIGALGDTNPNGKRTGSTYVYTASDDTWTQQTKLTASDGDKDDDFGSSVAVSGDGSTAIIGAKSDKDPNGFDAGSAYVFM